MTRRQRARSASAPPCPLRAERLADAPLVEEAVRASFRAAHRFQAEPGERDAVRCLRRAVRRAQEDGGRAVHWTTDPWLLATHAGALRLPFPANLGMLCFWGERVIAVRAADRRSMAHALLMHMHVGLDD